MAEESSFDSHVTIGQKHSLVSKTLGEIRPYWVHLPSSYDDTTYSPQHYPVLCLLDGDAHFHVTTGIVSFRSETANGNLQMPECIVVAIPNTDRTRDLTPTHSTISVDGEEDPWLETSGGGNAFLQFMKDELFPEIEAQYRTLPYRLLVGHSLGGLLALHALLTFPDMFQAYIAIDPSLWWDAKMLTRTAERVAAGEQALTGRAYVSFASRAESGVSNLEALDEAKQTFVNVMKSLATSEFWFDSQNFESENHNTVVLPSLYYGLQAIFEGYRPLVNKTVEQPSSLIGHFEQLSNLLGIVRKPPANFVSMVGFFLLHGEKEVNKALEAYNLNIANYPDSPQVYADIAEAYAHAGEKTLAIENYQKSLALNPGNQSVKGKLEALVEDR